MAGLWESWRDPEGRDILSTTIVVGAASEWMSAYHDRTSVVLDWRETGAWIAGDSPLALLRPAPEGALQEWIVMTRVNKAGVGDEDATLIAPAHSWSSPNK